MLDGPAHRPGECTSSRCRTSSGAPVRRRAPAPRLHPAPLHEHVSSACQGTRTHRPSTELRVQPFVSGEHAHAILPQRHPRFLALAHCCRHARPGAAVTCACKHLAAVTCKHAVQLKGTREACTHGAWAPWSAGHADEAIKRPKARCIDAARITRSRGPGETPMPEVRPREQVPCAPFLCACRAPARRLHTQSRAPALRRAPRAAAMRSSLSSAQPPRTFAPHRQGHVSYRMHAPPAVRPCQQHTLAAARKCMHAQTRMCVRARARGSGLVQASKWRRLACAAMKRGPHRLVSSTKHSLPNIAHTPPLRVHPLQLRIGLKASVFVLEVPVACCSGGAGSVARGGQRLGVGAAACCAQAHEAGGLLVRRLVAQPAARIASHDRTTSVGPPPPASRLLPRAARALGVLTHFAEAWHCGVGAHDPRKASHTPHTSLYTSSARRALDVSRTPPAACCASKVRSRIAPRGGHGAPDLMRDRFTCRGASERSLCSLKSTSSSACRSLRVLRAGDMPRAPACRSQCAMRASVSEPRARARAMQRRPDAAALARRSPVTCPWPWATPSVAAGGG
jgi:hypothetical protein